MAVTNNIREIREQRGIYQDDLAAAIGFSTKTVGRIDSSMRTVSFGPSTRKLPVPADTAFSKISMLLNGIILAVCFSYIPDAWSRLIYSIAFSLPSSVSDEKGSAGFTPKYASSFILFIMRNRIKMFTWWHSEMRVS